MLGTPAVLIGVGGVTLLQFAFTYAPVMQRLFETRAVAFADGLAIVGVGVAVLVVVEVEKRVRGRWRGGQPLLCRDFNDCLARNLDKNGRRSRLLRRRAALHQQVADMDLHGLASLVERRRAYFHQPLVRA